MAPRGKPARAGKGQNAGSAGATGSLDPEGGITRREVREVEDRSSPRTPVIYEIVRRLGEEEMARPAISLWWSGLAAGLSISFSVLAQSILYTHLPDTSWRPLVSELGYSVGFVMVVMSRQQLFTENTVTAVLPVMAERSFASLASLARMWGIVLAANLVGTLLAAAVCTFTPTLSPDLYDGMIVLSRHLLGHSDIEMFFKSIGAGFLIAAMVWLIPSAESAQFHVIILLTYLIAAGGFMHIIAGSVEAFLLFLHGDMDALQLGINFLLPVLLGNIVGGTALFAMIAYAQVMKEI